MKELPDVERVEDMDSVTVLPSRTPAPDLPVAQPSWMTRTDAKKIRDQILDGAEGNLVKAQAMIEEALELFSLLEVPRHQTLPMIIVQQIQQITDYRWLHP